MKRFFLFYDEAILLRLRRLHKPWAIRMARTFTHVGDTTSWFFFAFAMLAAGQTKTAFLMGFGAGIASGLAQAVKRVAKRPRPSAGIKGFEALVDNPDAFSFPSGHTAAAIGIAIAVAGTPIGPATLALACLIAVSRVYLGAHYPLDVMAGAALGTLAGIASRLLLGA